MRYKREGTSLLSHFLFAKDCCCLVCFSFLPCLPVLCLSRLCRYSTCCSLAPQPDSVMYFQGKVLPLTSRDRLQVNPGVCEAPAGFLCRSGRTCRMLHCVLRPEAPSSISFAGFACSGLWTVELFAPASHPSPSQLVPHTAVRTSSPDTAFILALPRALVGLCFTSPGISSFSCCFVNSDLLCSVC